MAGSDGLPRPTFDVDFVLAVPRERLADLFAAIEAAWYRVPDSSRGGWGDSVGGMPLVTITGPRRAGLKSGREILDEKPRSHGCRSYDAAA